MATDLAVQPTPGLFTAFRHRDFRLLVAGQTFSTLGDLFFAVALPFLVLRSGGGVGELSLTLTVMGAARLASTPIGGMVTDRLSPRTAMIVSDVARAVILVALAWLGSAGQIPLAPLLTVAALLGVFEGVYLPAYRAITPSVLPEEELQKGNSVGEASYTVAAIAGPFCAGFAVAWFSVSAVILLDAATFVISAITVAAMRRAVVVPEKEEQGDGAGFWAFFRRSALMRVVLLMTAMVAITATGTIAVALPLLAESRFSDGAQGYGIFLGVHSIGMLAGALGAGALAGSKRRGYISLALLTGHALALISLPQLVDTPVAMFAVISVLGLVDGALGILVMTLLQQIAPPGVLGRVMAAFSVVGVGSYPLAVAIAGVVVSQWGVGPMFLFGGVGLLFVAAFGLTQRPVRSI